MNHRARGCSGSGVRKSRVGFYHRFPGGGGGGGKQTSHLGPSLCQDQRQKQRDHHNLFFFLYKPLLSRNIAAQLWRTTCVCYSVYVHHSSHFGVKAAAGEEQRAGRRSWVNSSWIAFSRIQFSLFPLGFEFFLNSFCF